MSREKTMLEMKEAPFHQSDRNHRGWMDGNVEEEKREEGGDGGRVGGRMERMSLERRVGCAT
jgi:hypothetical protein